VRPGNGLAAAAGRPGGYARWFRTAMMLVLGIYSLSIYLLFFRPATRGMTELESDLLDAHQQIAATGFGYSENPGEALKYVRSKLERVRQLAGRLSAQITFHPEMDYLLSSPFRVLEFEQRRFDIQQSLTQLARAHGASLPADLFAGLPAYDAATDRPELLWLHLEFFNHVMTALLSSGQNLQVEQIEALPLRLLGATSVSEGTLFQLQLHLKVQGSAAALAVFLNASLPGAEQTENSLGEKAYSIDRLDLQRADDPEQVILDTRLTGFIVSDQVF